MGEAGVRDSSNKFSCSLKNMTLTLSNGNTYLGSTSKGLCTHHIERNVKTFIIIWWASFWSFCPIGGDTIWGPMCPVYMGNGVFGGTLAIRS